MLENLKNWDTELFLWLNNQGQPSWDRFWLLVSETEVWFPLYAVLLGLFLLQFRNKSFFWALPFVALTVVFTDQGSVQLFKEQFQRLRPCHAEALIGQMRTVKEGCGGKYGFISSHASNTFGLALMAGLSLRRKFSWLLPVLLLWAAFVSYSRIYLGVHYPLDIIVGGLYGSLCGFLVYRLFFLLVRPRYRRAGGIKRKNK